MTTYGEAVKALLRANFTHRNIIDMSNGEDGRNEVIEYGEEAIRDEAKVAKALEEEK